MFALCICLLNVMYLLDMAYRKFYLARCLSWFHCAVLFGWTSISISSFLRLATWIYTGEEHCPEWAKRFISNTNVQLQVARCQ